MEIVDTYTREGFAALMRPSSVNIVFGAGAGGRLALAGARECGMTIRAICDNSHDKAGGTLDGVGIVSPEEAARQWKGANFILAVGGAAALREATRQLGRLDVKKCFDVQFLRRFLVDSKAMRARGGDVGGRLDDMEWLADMQQDFAWGLAGGGAAAGGYGKFSPCVTWGDQTEVKRLGVQQDTRKWAYGWIVDYLRRMGKVDLLCDFGGGDVDAYFPGRLSTYANSMVIVDRFGKDGAERGNIRQLVADMECRIEGLADESVDVVTSSSAIEHLSRAGQINVFSEINRVLKPNGLFCGTISYVTNLTPENRAILNRDPMVASIGSPPGDPLDLSALLAAAPDLLVPGDMNAFPGYAGFSESGLLSDPSLLSDIAGSYPGFVGRSETDALQLKWYELGLGLPKRP